MRILHVLDHSPPLASAYTRRVMAILRQQRQLGWQTCQLTGPAQGDMADAGERRAPHWHFYRTAAATSAFERRTLAGAVHRLSARLQHVVRLTRPQLLHAHSPLVNLLAALRVGRRHGLPVLFEAHAPAPFSPAGSIWMRQPCTGGAGGRTAATPIAGALFHHAMRTLEAWMAARAGAVVTNSEGMRQRLQAGGVAARRITLVPQALELDRLARRTNAVSAGAALAPGRPVQLGLALDGPAAVAQQTIALALAALAQLQGGAAPARLLVTGDPAQLASVQRQAARRGLGRQITMLGQDGDSPAHGWQADGASECQLAARLHQQADIVLFAQAATQAVAAPPVQLLEAMARGCVVAATDTPSHRELIDHGHSGVLFTADDPQALAGAVRTLMRERARWPQIAASARWCIDYQRSWKGCAGRYGAVYEALLRGR